VTTRVWPADVTDAGESLSAMDAMPIDPETALDERPVRAVAVSLPR
jgi:hypothetical protein